MASLTWQVPAQPSIYFLHKSIYHPKGRPLLDTAPVNANPSQNHFLSLSFQGRSGKAPHYCCLTDAPPVRPYRRTTNLILTCGSATAKREKAKSECVLGEVCWFVCTLAFPFPRRNPTELSHNRPTGLHYKVFVAGLCSPSPFNDTGRPLGLIDTSSANLLVIEPAPFIDAQSSIRLSVKQVSTLRVLRPEFG